jgi:hypothetical protein
MTSHALRDRARAKPIDQAIVLQDSLRSSVMYIAGGRGIARASYPAICFAFN